MAIHLEVDLRQARAFLIILHEGAGIPWVIGYRWFRDSPQDKSYHRGVPESSTVVLSLRLPRSPHMASLVHATQSGG